MRGAACAGSDPARWHPDPNLRPAAYDAAVEAAKAICRTCPAREECLAMALEMGGRALGIMGATTLAERRQMAAMPTAGVALRAERAEAARTMAAAGTDVRAIATQLAVHPKSVMRYLRQPEPERVAS